MPKAGNNHIHLEQVRRFILKNGFQEPIIISCDLTTGRAYITEGNHRLWVAIQEGIPFIPCRVIPHWLPPNGSYKKLEIDFSTLNFPWTTNVCLIGWNHVNGGEQLVKTLILGPQALQTICEHTERLETVL